MCYGWAGGPWGTVLNVYVGHPPPGVQAQLIGRAAAADLGVHGTPYDLWRTQVPQGAQRAPLPKGGGSQTPAQAFQPVPAQAVSARPISSLSGSGKLPAESCCIRLGAMQIIPGPALPGATLGASTPAAPTGPGDR